MIGLRGIVKAAKFAGRLSGVLGAEHIEDPPVRARKIRLAVTALVAALLVWAGVDPDVAAAVGELIEALATPK